MQALVGQYPCLDQAIRTRNLKERLNLVYKTIILNGFRVLDDLIQTLGMLLELRKAKKLLACDSRFLNSRNIPACLNQAMQTRKPL